MSSLLFAYTQTTGQGISQAALVVEAVRVVHMPYRECVSEYIRACEALLNSSELSEDEQEVVEEMTYRILEERLSASGE